MEMNPSEAITNNVIGTKNVLDIALAEGVEHFVMISTDKAVNPRSIMGASKRVAELLVYQAAQLSSKHYVIVRFGSVLGSRGSVVLSFRQQIAAGGPVTVTDAGMRRYFMTIQEAVQLVLQAAVLNYPGKTFVLDMGEPVRIVDLARDLIELSGLEVGHDINIVFTGRRAGEKLSEELFIPGETYERTECHEIFVGMNGTGNIPEQFEDLLETLRSAADQDDIGLIQRALRELVPEFQPPEDEQVHSREPEYSTSEDSATDHLGS